MFSHGAPMSTPKQSKLKQRVLRAGGWTVAGFGLSQVIRFGSNLLMTRILVPEMFGVMAIAQMVMYGLALFSDVGLRQNIVQSKRGNDAAFLNTAWVIQIMRGVLIWCFALAVSLLVELANHFGMAPSNSVYTNPSLPYVIAIVSFSTVISGFASTKLYEASRNFSLGRVTQIEIGSQVAGVLCMIGWVAVDRSIWALVAGSLCSVLVGSILSHVWLPGVANRWQWDNMACREIIHFGKWIFLSSIIGFFVNSGDRVLLGGLVSASTLGVYVIAYLIVSSVENVLTKIIGNVSFPVLSEVVRERPAALKATYYRFHVIIASFTYFCAGILMMSGHVLIGLLYDRRYSDAGWMMEILAAALLTVPFEIAPQCFQALGMPKLLSNIIAIRLATLFLITPIGFHFFGLPGALWGIALSSYSGLPPIIFYMAKYGLLDIKKELLLLPMILVGMIMGKAFNFTVGY